MFYVALKDQPATGEGHLRGLNPPYSLVRFHSGEVVFFPRWRLVTEIYTTFQVTHIGSTTDLARAGGLRLRQTGPSGPRTGLRQ